MKLSRKHPMVRFIWFVMAGITFDFDKYVIDRSKIKTLCSLFWTFFGCLLLFPVSLLFWIFALFVLFFIVPPIKCIAFIWDKFALYMEKRYIQNLINEGSKLTLYDLRELVKKDFNLIFLYRCHDMGPEYIEKYLQDIRSDLSSYFLRECSKARQLLIGYLNTDEPEKRTAILKYIIANTKPEDCPIKKDTKQSNLFVRWLRAKKANVCPLIEWED